MDPADIVNRFTFHPTTPENGHAERHEAVRERMLNLAAWANEVLPEGREKSLVITHLEEALMWANAAIARS